MNRKNNHFETIIEARRLIARYRWRFIVPCFAVTLAVLVATLFLPRKYEAKAIFERRNDLVMSEIAGHGAPKSYRRIRSAMNEELAGLPAVEAVVDDLGILADPGEGADAETRRQTAVARTETIQRFHRNLWLRYDISTPDVDRVQVNFVDTDPKRAQAVVNRLIENYIEQARNQVDQMLRQAMAFYTEKLEEHRGEIERLEERRLKFELANAEVLPDDSSRLLASLAEAEQRLLTTQQDQRAARQRIAALRSQLDDLDDSRLASVVTRTNPELATVRNKLNEYRDRLDNALVIERMTDQHPTVVTLRQRIAELEAQLAQIPAEVVAERVFRPDSRRRDLELALQAAESDLEAATALHEASGERVAQLRARNTQLFPLRNEYRKIEREIEHAQRQASYWEDNVRRIQVALDAELGNRGVNMAFIKPATEIRRPSSPDFVQVVFAAMVLGLLTGICAVFVSERLDQTFRSVDHAVNHLAAPVVGTVAEIITRRRAAARRFVRVLLYPALATTMAAAIVASIYLNYKHLNAPAGQTTIVEEALSAFEPETWVPVEFDFLGSIARRD